jgi:hypothetical protein
MGQPIAAFRTYALRARESLDLWRFDAICDDTRPSTGPEEEPEESPAGDWLVGALQTIWFMSDERRLAAEYVADLHSWQRTFELNHPRKPGSPPGALVMGSKLCRVVTRNDFYYERRKGRKALRSLSEEAICEAIYWGPLAERVEAYARRLFNATESMVHSVADTLHPKRPSKPTDYAAIVEEWFDAFDGLAPFTGEPAGAAYGSAVAAAEEEFPPRPVGRPKRNDEALERALVDGWLSLVERCSETSEPAPSKPQYIADRNRDALKDPTLLAALNVTHLRLLNNGLRARRRKRQGTRTKRR